MNREFIDRALAVKELIGDGFQISHTGEITTTNGQKVPTIEEVDTKLKDLLDDYDAKKYQRDRQPEYPSIPDQLDKIYHSGINEWKKDIKAVKDKYPKP